MYKTSNQIESINQSQNGSGRKSRQAMMENFLANQTTKIINDYKRLVSDGKTPFLNLYRSFYNKLFGQIEESYVKYYESKIKQKDASVESLLIGFMGHFKQASQFIWKQLANAKQLETTFQLSEQNNFKEYSRSLRSQNVCQACSHVIAFRNVQFQKARLQTGQFRDPFNLFCQGLMQFQQQRENPDKWQQIECEQNQKQVYTYMHALKQRIACRTSEIINFVNEISKYGDENFIHNYLKIKENKNKQEEANVKTFDSCYKTIIQIIEEKILQVIKALRALRKPKGQFVQAQTQTFSSYTLKQVTHLNARIENLTKQLQGKNKINEQLEKQRQKDQIKIEHNIIQMKTVKTKIQQLQKQVGKYSEIVNKEKQKNKSILQKYELKQQQYQTLIYQLKTKLSLKNDNAEKIELVQNITEESDQNIINTNRKTNKKASIQGKKKNKNAKSKQKQLDQNSQLESKDNAMKDWEASEGGDDAINAVLLAIRQQKGKQSRKLSNIQRKRGNNGNEHKKSSLKPIHMQQPSQPSRQKQKSMYSELESYQNTPSITIHRVQSNEQMVAYTPMLSQLPQKPSQQKKQVPSLFQSQSNNNIKWQSKTIIQQHQCNTKYSNQCLPADDSSPIQGSSAKQDIKKQSNMSINANKNEYLNLPSIKSTKDKIRSQDFSEIKSKKESLQKIQRTTAPIYPIIQKQQEKQQSKSARKQAKLNLHLTLNQNSSLNKQKLTIKTLYSASCACTQQKQALFQPIHSALKSKPKNKNKTSNTKAGVDKINIHIKQGMNSLSVSHRGMSKENNIYRLNRNSKFLNKISVNGKKQDKVQTQVEVDNTLDQCIETSNISPINTTHRCGYSGDNKDNINEEMEYQIDRNLNFIHSLKQFPAVGAVDDRQHRQRQTYPSTQKQRYRQEQKLGYKYRINQSCAQKQTQQQIFSGQDVKNVYLCLQAALEHEKKLQLKNQIHAQNSGYNTQKQTNNVLKQEQFKYLNKILTLIASIHVKSVGVYQSVKNMLLYPFKRIIAKEHYLQFANFNLLNNSANIKSLNPSNYGNQFSCTTTSNTGRTSKPYEGGIKQSIINIILLHRMCRQNGKPCKHLLNFANKLQQLSQQNYQKISQSLVKMNSISSKVNKNSKRIDEARKKNKQDRSQKRETISKICNNCAYNEPKQNREQNMQQAHDRESIQNYVQLEKQRRSKQNRIVQLH